MFLQKTAPKNARNVVISTKINISLREKEKTVSLVLLPTQPQLNPKAIVAASLILSTLCRYNITPICELQSKYMPDAYIWYIFLKNIKLYYLFFLYVNFCIPNIALFNSEKSVAVILVLSSISAALNLAPSNSFSDIPRYALFNSDKS